MHIENLQLTTIEELCDDYDGWDYRYIQLSPGSLNYNTQIVELQGVELHWRHFGAKLLLKEVYQGTDLWFGFYFDGSSLPIYQGQECEFGTALVWRTGEEQEYIIPPSASTLTIRVDASLMKQRGWIVTGRSLQSVNPRQLQNLLGVCRTVSDTVDHARKYADQSTLKQGSAALREGVLDALESALSPWLLPQLELQNTCHHKNNYYQIFKEASSRLEHGLPLQMEELAQSLKISDRKLYRAFRRWLGMGPYEYMQIVRLHSLRNKLLTASSTEISITQLAGECGFKELGRLSVTYRKYFGESPRDTLKYRNI